MPGVYVGYPAENHDQNTRVTPSGRYNGKLRDELLNGEIFYTLKEARILVEQWRIHYNTIRPHSSLGYQPPAPQTINPLVMLAATTQQ